MKRHPRVVAAVLALTLVTAACGRGDSRRGAGPSPSAITATTLGGSTTAAQTIGALAAAGVSTVRDENSTAPLVPVTGAILTAVTKDQATTMAIQASRHGGILGADLNALLPLPGAIHFDQLVGGWLIGATTPAAKEAARLVGTFDVDEIDTVPFPIEALQLFVADLVPAISRNLTSASSSPASSGTAPAPSSPSTGSSGGPLRSDPASPDGLGATALLGIADRDPVHQPCTSVADFVNSTLDRVFSALKLNVADVQAYLAGQLGGGVFGTIVNFFVGVGAQVLNGLIDVLHATVKEVLDELTQKLLNWLRAALGVVQVIMLVTSYLIKQPDAQVTPTPPSTKFSITGGPDISGTVTASVPGNDISAQWPEQIADCAKAADFTLPTLTTPGAPVTWSVAPAGGLISVSQPTGPPYRTVLDPNVQSTLAYVTGKEDAQVARTGTAFTDPVRVGVTITRTELANLEKYILNLFNANIPQLLQPLFQPIITDVINKVADQLNKVVGLTGSTLVNVTHHQARPKKVPYPVPSCSAGAAGAGVPAGTYRGPINAKIITTMHLSAGQATIPNAGGGTLSLTGTVTITSNGQTVTGTLTLSGGGTSQVGLPGSVDVHSDDSGQLTAVISGPASSPVINGTLSGAWASLDAPLGNTSGSDSSPAHVGLHVTSSTCSSVTGDAVALFRELAAPVAQYITITGTGAWTATKS